MAQYKVIAGTFHIKGFQPDGDSIRFQATNQANWDFFTWETEAAQSHKKEAIARRGNRCAGNSLRGLSSAARVCVSRSRIHAGSFADHLCDLQFGLDPDRGCE